jgi:hypothetical protein
VIEQSVDAVEHTVGDPIVAHKLPDARMAYTEAAGFLAHAHAWAHPLDLALRDLGLTASTALAAAGAPYRTLPQTFASTANITAWAYPPLDVLPAGDAAIAEALALAGALRGLAGRSGTSTSARVAATAQALVPLGASALARHGSGCSGVEAPLKHDSGREILHRPATRSD